MEKDSGKVMARRIIRFILAAAVVLFLAFIVIMNIAPFSYTLTYRIEMGKDPGEDAALKTGYTLGNYEYGHTYAIPEYRMERDQVTFSLKVPYDHYDRAEVSVRYRGDQDELQFGLMDGKTRQLTFRPVYNSSLNALDWPRITEGEATLFQKEDLYGSIGEFLAAQQEALTGMEAVSAGDARLATYFYSLFIFRPYLETAPGPGPTTPSPALRGAHTCFVKVEGGTLDLSLVKYDLNMYEDDDALVIRVLSEKDCVFIETIKDDGELTATYDPSPPQQAEIALTDLEDGYYKIELNCGNDVVIEDIAVSGGYLTFMDHLFLADHWIYMLGPSRPVTLYTNSDRLEVETWHEEALQNLTVDGATTFPVEEANAPATLEMPPGVNEIAAEHGDLYLSSPGSSFAFSPQALLIQLPHLLYTRDLPLQVIDNILTTYSLPVREGDAYLSEFTIDTSRFDITSNTLFMTFIAPGLESEGKYMEIESIEIKLIKR